MSYDTWLQEPPYAVTKEKKEAWFCEEMSELTQYHKEHCKPYGKFIKMKKVPETFASMSEIPFLPVSLFKGLDLKSVEDQDVFKILTSSGTTGQAVSKIYLDQKTAFNQQKTLYRILEEVIGPKRVPMLILDTPEVIKNRKMFTARGAGILGFAIVSSKRHFAFREDMSLDYEGIQEFLEKNAEGPVLVFGFTYMIWKHFYKALKESGKTLPLERGVMIHGGGWKKLQNEAVDAAEFNKAIEEVSGMKKIYNYYGMAEQTGCIYLQCPCGYFHASTYSDIMIRDGNDFTVCPPGKEGIIQVLSPLARSYPGHSLITEDQGILQGIDDCKCGWKGKYFTITGRIKHAEVRGCSDTYEG